MPGFFIAGELSRSRGGRLIDAAIERATRSCPRTQSRSTLTHGSRSTLLPWVHSLSLRAKAISCRRATQFCFRKFELFCFENSIGVPLYPN